MAIKAAFDELGDCVLLGVEEISGEGSNTIFGQATANIFKIHTRSEVGDYEVAVHDFVLGRLNELTSDSKSLIR